MEIFLLLADLIKDMDPEFNDVYINFIDRGNQKNIGIFQQEHPKINTLGGSINKGYTVKPARILIRYSEDAVNSYNKAKKIYSELNEYVLDSTPPIRFFSLLDEEPIFIEREANVCEYVIRVNILVNI